MKKYQFIIAGILFFILSTLVLRFFEPKVPLLSITQASGTRFPYIFEPPVRNIMGIQEVILKKDFINGIEIKFGIMGRENTNTNTLLVLDSNYNLLYKETFSSIGVLDASYRPFRFDESKKAGKGSKIFICCFSINGDSSNCIQPLFNSMATFGSLYTSVLVNDDVINSIKNKIHLYPGGWILRTYESDISLTPLRKWGWYLLVVLISLIIIFQKQLQVVLPKLKIKPEYVYPVIALVSGLLFVLLTPPFQVPDEGAHYARAYELTDLQLSNKDKTIPTSIFTLDSTLGRLHFNPEEKTSKKEILGLAKIKMAPETRSPSSGQDYIVPYLPQVLGFATGRLFGANPLYLLYMGRILNLFVAILLVFYAIKIVPFSKWIFFLLALMPKTVYLMASLSYDAFVISSSFLLLALYLYYAFKAEKLIGWKDIGLLFFLSMLLALCKPPFFILGFLFLIIPVRKIGSLPKYLLIFSVFVVSMLIAQGMWSLVGGLIKSAEAVKTEQVAAETPKPKDASKAPAIAQPVDPGKTDPAGVVEKQATSGSAVGGSNNQTATQPQNPAIPEINPGKQINYIKTHLSAFLKLLVVTNFDHMRANMLSNFVGTMGWLDTFLPDTLVDLYLILLMIAALCIAEEAIHVDWRRKTFFFILFLSGVVAIESAMYVYSSYVGQTRFYGIQGRYFIPLAPLFLLIFYNSIIAEKLNYIFSAKRKLYLKAKSKLKPNILLEINREQIFTKYLQVFIIGFTVVTLIRGVAAILLRYYQW